MNTLGESVKGVEESNNLTSFKKIGVLDRTNKKNIVRICVIESHLDELTLMIYLHMRTRLLTQFLNRQFELYPRVYTFHNQHNP